jgi:hypothetical protein
MLSPSWVMNQIQMGDSLHSQVQCARGCYATLSIGLRKKFNPLPLVNVPTTKVINTSAFESDDAAQLVGAFQNNEATTEAITI